MSVDFIIHIWKKEYYDEDVIKSFLSSDIGSKYFNPNRNWKKEEAKIVKKYGKPADVLIWNFPYFKYGKDIDLSERDREDLLEAFENNPVPINLKFVDKIPNLELKEFLERYVGQDAYAYLIAW